MLYYSGIEPNPQYLWGQLAISFSKQPDVFRLITMSSSYWLLFFSLLVVSDSCDPINWSIPGSTISHGLPKHMSFDLVMSPSHLILCCPLPISSIFSSIRVFSNELAFHIIRWPNCWSFSFSISPSTEFSGLMFFRIEWSNLLAVQGALNSLLQNYWLAGLNRVDWFFSCSKHFLHLTYILPTFLLS